MKLLEIARSSARVAGTDIKTAFDSITNAVANQQIRALKTFGILIEQNKAYEDYALKIGVAKDSLTELQKSQALADAAILAGQAQMQNMGKITLNASEMFQMLGSQWRQLTETIGKTVLKTGIFDFILSAVSSIKAKIDELSDTGKLTEWAEKIKNEFIKVAVFGAGLIDAITPIGQKIIELIKSAWDAFMSLPEWVREVGIVAAIFGGKKWTIVMLGILHLINAVTNEMKALQAVAAGKMTFAEFAASNFKELEQKLEDIARQSDKTGKALNEMFQKAKPESLTSRVVKLFQDLQKTVSQTDITPISTPRPGGFLEERKATPTEELQKLKLNINYEIDLENQKYEESHKALERSIALEKEKYEKGKISLKQYIDFEKQKYKEDQAALEQLIRTKLALQQYYAEESIKLKQRELEELQKEPTKNRDKMFQIEEEIKQIKIASASEQLKIQKELYQNINSLIDASKNKIKGFEDAIAAATAKSKQIAIDLNKDIADIEGKGKAVDPFEQWRKGMEALDAASKERQGALFGKGDLKSAEMYAQQAREIFKELGQVEGGEFDAAQGLIQTKEELLKIETTRKQASEEGLQAETANMQNLIAQAQSLKTEFSNMQLKVDSTELDAVIARYKGLDGSEVHVKVIEDRQAAPPAGYRWGGLVGTVINTALQTGSASVKYLASGGWLPGWGGGDKIKAALEAGEYVVRKEAVQKYGARLFDTLNSMKFDVPSLYGLNLAPASISNVTNAGRAETNSYKINFADNVVHATPKTKNLLAELHKELRMAKLRRG